MVSLKFLAKYKFLNNSPALMRNLSRICIHEEVRQAILEKQAVVALESTIITHGMKFPHNFQTATDVENTIRQQGAIPATIAVLNGQIKVGLTNGDLEELSQAQSSCLKISRRDYPYVISQKLTGGTTVSGTMIVAHKVGIPIFVTGGIGGVHRGCEATMDVSADLTELGRTPVAVFCSGVKSILDIGKTLEYLETQGVAVATYGQSKIFPEFYCRGSKFESPYNLETDEEAAQFIETIFNLQLKSGLIIGVPIPEKHSLNDCEIAVAIEEGLIMAKDGNVTGKNVTPFLLSKISEITQGKSLKANIALIKNNALVGGRIAVEHAKLRRENLRKDSSIVFDLGREKVSEKSDVSEVNSEVHPEEYFNVIVVGAINLDFVVNITDEKFRMDGRTFGGEITQGGGGVGRNIADALGKLDANPLLISAVGQEKFGDFILENTIAHLSSTGIAKIRDATTATCMVLCDHRGECLFVVGDMKIHDKITVDMIEKHVKAISDSALVVLDGNIGQETLEFALNLCHERGIPVWYEPTDYHRAHKPFVKTCVWRPNFISPNLQEFHKIYETLFSTKINEDEFNDMESCISKGYEMADFIDNIILTLGKEGVLIIRKGESTDPFFELSKKPRYVKKRTGTSVSHRFYRPQLIDEENVVNVSGAGDCFASGFIAAMLRGENEKSCVELGFRCARTSLECTTPVPPSFPRAVR